VLQVSLDLMLDPHLLLGLVAIQPMLESIDCLYIWSQKNDVFICDFVAALEVCEGQLYSFYVDHTTFYGRDDFWALNALLNCSHEAIHLKWVCDLNETAEAHLAFIVGGEQHFALHGGQPVSRAKFSKIVTSIKKECVGKLLSCLGFFITFCFQSSPFIFAFHFLMVMCITVERDRCSLGLDPGAEVTVPQARRP
jgi:hypothetical protein